MKDIELRFIDFKLEDSSDDELTVSGYVNEVGKLSHLLSSGRKSFRERIMPGAFSKSLSVNSEVHFLAEHDSKKILASTRNSSLELKEDEKGLFMKATISPTTYGKDYHTLIKDGILRNMSFGFGVLKDKWTKLTDGTYTRDITDLILYEVSVVTNPAYPQSTISARGLNLIEEVDIPDEVMEENTMSENNKEEVKVEEQPEVKTDVENVVEEQPKEEEVNVKQDVVKEQTQEKRAYIGGIYDSQDVMNSCINISAECMTLARYFSRTSTNVEMIPELKQMAQKFNELMLNQVEDPVEEQQEARSGEQPKQDVVKEQPKEKEKRGQDLTSFYAMLEEVKREEK